MAPRGKEEADSAGEARQNAYYRQAAAQYTPALERLARAYEADGDLRRDLLQDIHLALWRSFAGFDGKCALRTWTYRVAHNVAATHVVQRRRAARLMSLEEMDDTPDPDNPEGMTGDRQVLDRLMILIRTLKAPDSQVILLYLEEFDAAAIAEITGLSPGNVATRIHRIKALLARRFRDRSAS